MTDTWRFIIVISLLIVVGSLLPFAAEASQSSELPVIGEGSGHG